MTTMSKLYATLAFSLLLHGLCGYLLLTQIRPVTPAKTIVVDLTFESPPKVRPESPAKSSPQTRGLSRQPDSVQGTSGYAAKHAPQTVPISRDAPSVAVSTVVPVAAPVLPQPGFVSLPSPVTETMYRGRESGSSGEKAGTGNILPGPAGGDTTGESMKQRYLKEHFAYICELILKNLKYPPSAKKMGLSGSVVVAFVVRENGTAEDVKVLKSSGFALLDSNAVETVRKVSPFPKPPIQAELRIPVRYRLEQ